MDATMDDSPNLTRAYTMGEDHPIPENVTFKYDVDSIYMAGSNITHLLGCFKPGKCTFTIGSTIDRTSATTSSRICLKISAGGTRTRNSNRTWQNYKVRTAPLFWFPNVLLASAHVASGYSMYITMYYLGLRHFRATNYMTNNQMAVINLSLNMARNFDQTMLNLNYQQRVIKVVSRAKLLSMPRFETKRGMMNDNKYIKKANSSLDWESFIAFMRDFRSCMRIIYQMEDNSRFRKHLFQPYMIGFDPIPPEITIESIVQEAKQLYNACFFTCQAAGIKNIWSDSLLQINLQDLHEQHGEDWPVELRRAQSHCLQRLQKLTTAPFDLKVIKKEAANVAVFFDIGTEAIHNDAQQSVLCNAKSAKNYIRELLLRTRYTRNTFFSVVDDRSAFY
jgi:hypothetical protein